MTFAQLLDDFETSYMPRLAKPTRAKYASLIRVHVRPYFGAMDVAHMTTRKIDEWLAGKAAVGLSWATRADLRNLLSSIFIRAEIWETYMGKNPASRASAGRKAARYEKRKISVADTRRLLTALRPDVRLVCMVALFCGLRISEVLGLCWKHVDFERGMLLVRQRYWRGDIDRTKSDAADRDIPFGDLSALLRDLRPKEGAMERYCFEVRTIWGVTRDDRSIRRYFLKPAAVKVGIYHRGFGFHSFRREAVTAIAREAGAMQASRVAGHTRMDTTLVYVLGDVEAQDKAIRAIQKPFADLLEKK